MKHLIVILFILSLIGCGGGGSGGGGGGGAQVAQLPNTENPNDDGDNGNSDTENPNDDGDNGNSDTENPNDDGDNGNPPNPTPITQIGNEYHYRLVGVVPGNNNNFLIQSVHLNIDIDDVRAEIAEDARFGTKTGILNFTSAAGASYIRRRISNDYSIYRRGDNKPADNLYIDSFSVPILLEEGASSAKYDVPGLAAGGGVLNGLPTGTHRYGGIYNHSTRGEDRSNQNGFFVVESLFEGRKNFSFVTGKRPEGIMTVEANFDNMTGTIDSREVIYNGQSVNTTEDKFYHDFGRVGFGPDWSETKPWYGNIEVTGNFNINATDGSFAGTGNLVWKNYQPYRLDDSFGEDISGKTTINGNFHGTNANSVSGTFHTEQLSRNPNPNGTATSKVKFVGGFIAEKQ